MYIGSPCKNCPNKGCGSYHSQCEDYLKFKEKVDKENQNRLKAKEFEDIYLRMKVRELDKGKRRKRSI